MIFTSIYYLGVSWNGEACRLILHWEDGFLLTKDTKEEDSRDNEVIWKYPYERLRCSSDDAKCLLWLDFGGEDGEQVFLLVMSILFHEDI